MEHIHNAFLCPPHVGGCSCDDLTISMCNPYYKSGHCPDLIEALGY